MCRQQLKHIEVGCSVLIALARGQGTAEVNCASPATEEEGGGISFMPLNVLLLTVLLHCTAAPLPTDFYLLVDIHTFVLKTCLHHNYSYNHIK